MFVLLWSEAAGGRSWGDVRFILNVIPTLKMGDWEEPHPAPQPEHIKGTSQNQIKKEVSE